MKKMKLVIVSLVLAITFTGTLGQFESPCPRLFSYEPQKENDRWYGVVTLISDSDLKGVWLRLVFDRPSLQLGNWFGEIRTTDNTEYLIHNRNHELKANMPYALRFYLKFNPSEPPPKLVGFRLNARPACPEGQTTTPAAITGGSQLITSAPSDGNSGDSATTASTPTTRKPSATFTRPGGGWPGNSRPDDDDDDVFQGDFQLINRPHLRPTVEAECGTVVSTHERSKRSPNSYYQQGRGDNIDQHHYHHGDYYYDRNNYRHNREYHRTPNFPQVSFVYVTESEEQQSPSEGSWNLREWIKQFLQDRYNILDTNINNYNSQSSTTEATTTTTSTEPTKLVDSPKVYSGNQLNSTLDDFIMHRTPLNPDHAELFTRQTQEQNHLEGGDDIAPLEQQPRPLITYGQGTKEGEFPWHAALYHERGADLQYICGASLISRQHVITVAHCVTRKRTASTLNPESLVVYLGKYYLKKWSNPGIQDSQVSAIIPHPEYNSQTYANDLAILQLLNPVAYTDYVRPICLWGDGDNLESVVNKRGTVVGWGFDHTGKVTEELTQAKMPVVTKETCIYSFPDFFSRFTTSKTYCAGFRNGTSVCNGDSGGGMVFPKQTSTPGREVWQLRGLVSISVALQNQFKCDSSHYVVFTDVAKYLDWIHTVMKK